MRLAVNLSLARRAMKYARTDYSLEWLAAYLVGRAKGFTTLQSEIWKLSEIRKGGRVFFIETLWEMLGSDPHSAVILAAIFAERRAERNYRKQVYQSAAEITGDPKIIGYGRAA